MTATENECKDKVRQMLSQSTKDYWVGHEVEVLENPSPLEFMKKAVSCYKPVIIRGIMDDWRAMDTWDMDSFRSRLQDRPVSVNVSPDGLADAVKLEEFSDGDVKEVFTYPLEVQMPFSLFYDMMTSPEIDDAVPYLSEQNDNLRQKFPQLFDDVPPVIPLAAEVFDNCVAEAVNLWIGDDRSVTSMHKDHFENFYCVISGEKTFTLLPPTDTAFIPEETFETCTYKNCSGEDGRIKRYDLSLVRSSDEGSDASIPANSISWIPIDPDRFHEPERYPQFCLASPMRCTLFRGDVLYIPAMWYHRVSQNALTIAVNYWIEQSFDFRFVFYQSARCLFHTDDYNLLDNEDSSSRTQESDDYSDC